MSGVGRWRAAAGTPLVIYHGGCPDGFCSAWIALRVRPDAELVGCHHGDPPPRVAGRDVLVVDFSFPREILVAMAAEAASLCVLDHHQTAQRALAGLPFCTFDMTRSGATLTWDALFPDRPRPWLVAYVEDRDLWRWALPDSRAVCAALSSVPFEAAAWDEVAARSPADLVAPGNAILAHQAIQLRGLLRLATRRAIAGHDVPVVNSPVLQSELGNLLSLGEPFAAAYCDTGDGRREYSLRSQPDGLDVAVIAERFGGGGHPRASGFTVDPDEDVSAA